MGANPYRKGSGGEREVVAILNAYGFNACRRGLYEKLDVLCAIDSHDRLLEVKRKKSCAGEAYSAFDNGAWAYVARADKKPWLITIPLKTFLELAGASSSAEISVPQKAGESGNETAWDGCNSRPPAPNSLTYDRVRQLFDYSDGELIWRTRLATDFASARVCNAWNARYAGKSAGQPKPSGYLNIKADGKSYRAHRLIWLHVHGMWPVGEIDHIDHDRSNNLIENLRDVSRLENAQNLSNVRGVWWDEDDRKWRASICVNRKRTHLGRFDKLEDAVAARASALKEAGFHENHGTPSTQLHPAFHEPLDEEAA